MNESLLVECAQWLYAKNQENITQGRTLWWQPHILTNHNPDKSNPRVSIEDAYEVFIELVRRRLAVHVFAEKDGNRFPAFEILEGKHAEWKKLIDKKGFWELTAKPALKWLFSQVWLLILFIGGIITTVWLTHLTEHILKDTPEIYDIRIDESQLKAIIQQEPPK